ncbi:MAG: RNA-binding protein [Pseudomonadota bacterium]
MARGGRAKEREAPERRCIATGRSGPTAPLIRFVLSPDGERVVPDLAAKLPGRGAWLTADRALAEKAEAKRLFSRAFRRAVALPEGLPYLLENLLARRLIETVALARKAGQAVTGFEKVRARLPAGNVVLLTACNAAAEGRRKLLKLAPEAPEIAVLSDSELGLAFGREFAIHAALDAGGMADRALHEAGRLGGFRAPLSAAKAAGGGVPADVTVAEGSDETGAQKSPPEGD